MPGDLPPFYRAVSAGELADWRATGRLGPGPSGMEGKHLWRRIEHAAAFGRLVQRRLDPAEFHVLEVQFQPVADVPCYNELQDGIGPAYFADEDALNLIAEIRNVMAVPKYAPEKV